MTYNYRIFQCPVGMNYCFRDFQTAMLTGMSRHDYVSVYADTIEARTIGEALERIYMLHNMDNRPNGNYIRSLSMSDVVTINGIPYYCDDFGWSEIPSDRWGRR